ncbi:hypothetical protein GCM10010160_84370 [Acrocarpospora corrugata]
MLAALPLAVVPAAQANADSAGCRLAISAGDAQNNATVTLVCQQRSAGDELRAFKLMGSDTFSDDVEFTVYTTKTSYRFKLYEEVLNEDDGDTDEIYANAYFRRPKGTRYTLRSNKVNGSWGGLRYCCASSDRVRIDPGYKF